MTAQEAKQIAFKAQEINIENIYLLISNAAKKGDLHMRYDLVGIFAKFADNIIKKLKDNGYTVERIKGYDQRDRDSWDYLAISWS